MHLSDLNNPEILLPKNADKIPIKSITSDSRKLTKDCMFVAIKGYEKDGHDFIDEAISGGASNILVDYNYKVTKQLPLSKSKNVRKALALVASIYFNKQPNIIAAVTGTNGKTSVCTFLKQIWDLNNFKSASLGTLGLNASKEVKHKETQNENLTTLDPIKLHECISQIKQLGVDRLALEASSHGLEQHRLDGVKVSLACFTNLSHDHIDFHKSLNNYKKQKFRLFTEILQDSGTAVINIDDVKSKELLNKIQNRNINIITFGKSSNANWKIKKIFETGDHKTFELFVNKKSFIIPTALNSNFQIYNAVAAACLAQASGIPLEHSLESLKNLVSPKGRMQELKSHNGAKIYIDFSHTPDALESILKEKSKQNSKLFLVIGCGGNRDKQKRKIIGHIASKYSFKAIITDDNPRNENPKQIRSEIIRGKLKNKDNLIEIADRKQAILKVLDMSRKGDIVIIAGKGHEKYQIYGNQKIPHDDFKFCQDIIENKGQK